jgi:hypothetical protein
VRTLGGEICLRGKLFNLSGPSFVAPNAPAASAAALFLHLIADERAPSASISRRCLRPPAQSAVR